MGGGMSTQRLHTEGRACGSAGRQQQGDARLHHFALSARLRAVAVPMKRQRRLLMSSSPPSLLGDLLGTGPCLRLLPASPAFCSGSGLLAAGTAAGLGQRTLLRIGLACSLR